MPTFFSRPLFGSKHSGVGQKPKAKATLLEVLCGTAFDAVTM
ncbi:MULTISPECIES: hypothetical protein [Moorena]|nr:MULTISPECIES: hypothetical protein [Moorena]